MKATIEAGYPDPSPEVRVPPYLAEGVTSDWSHAVKRGHPRVTWEDGIGTIHQPMDFHPLSDCAAIGCG